jgi:uroporphyrinogen decarboxylase
MSNDKFDIINKAFKLETADRIPYSLWKHFPEDDKEPETLVKAQLDFQEKYDSDIMKISISGRAFAADFGAEIGGYDPVSGSRFNIKYPVEKIEDWNNIKKPVDPNSGEFGKIIETMRLVHKEVEGKVPTMMTLFSPFMIASQLDKDIISHAEEDPTFIGNQIKMITEVMTEFIKGTIDAGTDGIFLATQHLNHKL